jgi:uracil-DNA glycosylase family 4
MQIDFGNCPIRRRDGILHPEGTGSLGVLILGDHMTAEDVKDGLPFRPASAAGSVLERAIRRGGFYRDQFILWNVIPTSPANDWFPPESVEWGRPYLEEIISKYKPKAILALGDVATSAVTGLAGPKLGVNYLTGFVLPSHYGIPVVPCFHPADLRKGKMTRLGVLIRSLKLAVEAASGKEAPFTADESPAKYKMHPTEEEAGEFFYAAKHCAEYLAYDIETPMSDDEDEAEEHEGDIISIQFSAAEGTGIYLPWRKPFIEISKAILSLPTPKLSWNGWKFDEPRLARHGVKVEGENHDLQWAWHHLQPDLPRKLQFAAAQMGWRFPWKHLGRANPQFYGIVDVDVLQWLRPRIFQALQDRGLYKSYGRHIVALEPVLRRMSERGIPVNPALHASVKAEVAKDQDKVFAELQQLVPPEVKPFHPKDGYKKPPKDLASAVKGAYLLKAFGKEERWVKLKEWKPSNKGLVSYIKLRGYPVPKDLKTKKDTTAELEIKRLAVSTHDPVFEKVVEYREAGVIIDNHLKNWTPGPDGKVHSTFYFHPATGQLSSRRPNVQNAPEHKGHAKLFKSMIAAEPDHVLLNFDYKSFHAQTLAFESKDKDYLRLAKLDIHSYLTAHLMHEPRAKGCLAWGDDELREYLAWVKEKWSFVRDYKAKRAILGYGFGMGYVKLYEMNKESFESRTDAKRTLDMLNAQFPVTAAWRDEIKMRAHEQGYLLSRHGYIRYFWEVFRYKGGHWERGGEDAEAAIAFLPANIAFGEMRDRMLNICEKNLDNKYGLVNNVHDSLVFHCPKNYADEAIAAVKNIMEEPSKVLVNTICPKGLSVEVGVKRGLSMDKMEKMK